MKRQSVLYLVFLACLMGACSKAPDPTIEAGANPPEAPVEGDAEVLIDVSNTFQTIESFAASDAWFTHYVGGYWAAEDKERIAELLFSKEIVNGQPKGIGLSGWRFNLGGGTMQQGSASDIEDISRRAESFIDPVTGDLDWNRQAGQQYFLDKAKTYGVEQLVLFSNTPPVNYTINGKGYSSNGASANLKPTHYGDFARYMVSVLDYFKSNKGISFDFVSPVNEPQYNWGDPGQEGSGWQNSEIKKLAVELDGALEEKGLQTKVLLAEAAAWNHLYESDGDPGRKQVIRNLFSPGSAHYVGDLKHVAPIIAGHSYWTDGNWQNLLATRKQVAQSASEAGLKVYQTEWSMLGDGYDANEFVGFEKASFLDIALYMAKVIHTDLVYAQVASWSYWTALSTERWGHKNRFLLIKVTPGGGDYGDLTQSGTHEASKTLWVLGNHSLFIRPGYTRVDLQLNGTSKDRFGSAYLSPDKKRLVAVYTNLSGTSFNAKAQIPGKGIASIKAYTTSATQNLAERTVDRESPIVINPQTVTTVVYNLE